MMAEAVGPSAQVVPVPNLEWPPDLLYVHLMGKLEEFKSHMGDLRTADAAAAHTAILNAREALTAALASADKANAKYEADVERWRIANNEWRATLVDREVKFLLIDTFNARVTAIDGALTAINDAIGELRSFRDISLALGPRVDALDKQVDEIKDWRNKQLGRSQAQLLISIGLFALITFAARFLGS